MTTEMFISDIIYLTFLMVLLFIIIYKGFTFGGRINLPEDQQFNIARDSLYFNRHCFTRADRQANVFTVQDENSRESRYNDIFFIEPNSAEAARIRAQLEKDDKDLPSYEEVMRMTSVTTPTTTSAAGVTGLTASNASVNTTETILAVPPYSEVDPIAAAAATSSSGNNTSSSASAARTSTAPPPMPAAMVSTATDITHQASSVV
ncbi:uncharacterized protein LOC101894094 isoform X4 [Musca domestica]|uniref:Uncharacterized protein LOC101894094 isoform X4 n=1 Tax=Musca domestica TaxID=7370 RepID=A0A1I8MDC3_MUSDO|nr:uncharacterized protein LOC101894094 isoform X4 [Musca domestica]